jgi:hypothetical protein
MDVGGVREMIDEGVTIHLVRIRDSAALSERLVVLLTNNERRHAMGTVARKRVETECTLSRGLDVACALSRRSAAGQLRQVRPDPVGSASCATNSCR